MAELIRMPLGDGGEDDGELIVELADGVGQRPVAARDQIQKASETLKGAMGGIRTASGEILDQLRDVTPKPTTVNVQFGMKLSGEAKVFTVSTSGEANFKVTLEWSSVHHDLGGAMRSGDDGDKGKDAQPDLEDHHTVN